MMNDPRDRIVLADRGARRRKLQALHGIDVRFLLALASVVTVIALAVVGVMVAYAYQGPEYVISSELAARLDPTTRLAAKRLVSEPCNRTLASQLVGALSDQAEYATVISFSTQTETKCGPNEELLRPVFAAQMGSADFVGADRTASELIAQYPANPHVYGWRAEAREKRGDPVGAYADMRTTLSLFLDPSNVALSVYYDVARLAAKTGKPCDGVVTLRDYIAYDPENRRTQQLATVMRDWQTKGDCAPLSGTGTALIRFDPNGSAIIVSVEVNGVPGHMIVDTGASRTALSKQFADRAGIEATDLKGAIVTTANGKTWVSGGRADFISLGGAHLSMVPVFVQESSTNSFGDGIDGLLGLSFLGNFQVHIHSGVLELRPLE